MVLISWHKKDRELGKSKKIFLYLNCKETNSKVHSPFCLQKSHAVIINPIVIKFCFQNIKWHKQPEELKS